MSIISFFFFISLFISWVKLCISSRILTIYLKINYINLENSKGFVMFIFIYSSIFFIFNILDNLDVIIMFKFMVVKDFNYNFNIYYSNSNFSITNEYLVFKLNMEDDYYIKDIISVIFKHY